MCYISPVIVILFTSGVLQTHHLSFYLSAPFNVIEGSVNCWVIGKETARSGSNIQNYVRYPILWRLYCGIICACYFSAMLLLLSLNFFTVNFVLSQRSNLLWLIDGNKGLTNCDDGKVGARKSPINDSNFSELRYCYRTKIAKLIWTVAIKEYSIIDISNSSLLTLQGLS